MKTLYIIRHGETAWSLSGQHTGSTDLELTPNGIDQALRLSKRLKTLSFEHVFTSSLKRAVDTMKCCGFEKKAVILDDLKEWDYGDYEGKTTDEILRRNPHWNLFKEGALNGESLSCIAKRTARLFKHIENLQGEVALFTSSHISRAIAAHFLGFDPSFGKHLHLNTASLSILSYERDVPIISLWNDTSHLDKEL